jgi:hypothetical protein
MKSTCIAFSLFLAGTTFISAAEVDQPGAIPWGPEQHGVQTRLIPLADSYQVGNPMPFKLEMKNVSDKIIQYDSQSVGVNDSMSVVRSSGESVPYVAGPSSTLLWLFVCQRVKWYYFHRIG